MEEERAKGGEEGGEELLAENLNWPQPESS